MNISTLISVLGTATLSVLLGLLIHASVSMYQKLHEQHDPQANQGALIRAPHANANDNANNHTAIAGGRAPRLIRDANAAHGELVALGNPANNGSFWGELVSELANILSIIWAYLRPLLNRAYVAIVDLLDQFANIDKRAALRLLVTNFCRESRALYMDVRRAISDLRTAMDWVFFQHSAGFFLAATFYYVGALLVASLVSLYCGLYSLRFHHLSLSAVHDYMYDRAYGPHSLPDLFHIGPPLVFYFAAFSFYHVLIFMPCHWYLKMNFPFRQLNMPRNNATEIIEMFLILNHCIVPMICAWAMFSFHLIDTFMPGPLHATAHPIAFWLRQLGVTSRFNDFFFE